MTSRRNTIQKDLVRNTVYEMRRHVTANEVYEFIKENKKNTIKKAYKVIMVHHFHRLS